MTGTRLARGIRVGDRYRLERELGRGTGGTTWEAVDERLDRPVALRLFAPGSDRKTIVKRAGLAASLTHPRVVRVFDTGEDGGRFFTVSELVAESLQTVRLPLPPDSALQVAMDVAEALQYAHERGVIHGNLQESNVLLSEGGAKVGDFALSPNSQKTQASDDLRQFGALMRRVARVPDGAAPAGFVRVLEGLTVGSYSTAGEALTELRALRPVTVQETPGRNRWRGWVVIGVALLLGLVAFGAMRLGEHSPSQRVLPGGKITNGTPIKIRAVDDFDPEGDGAEGAGSVGTIIDGDPQTFWSTERYSGAADFSALKKPKSGVGVIFDIGQTHEIGKAQILFAAQGCSFELRFSENRNAPVGEWATLATVANSPRSAAIEFETATARYWLLWITKLTSGTPGAGEKFACGVSEATLFAP